MDYSFTQSYRPTSSREARSTTLSSKRGLAESPPGWKVETDRVHEGVFEGFRLAETGRVVPRGTKTVSLWLIDIREFESTGGLEAHVCGRRIDH
jgi:hypothetical protein